MLKPDRTVSLYIDCPKGGPAVKVDDFLIAIGKKQSNSVYHVAEVKARTSPKPRMTRYHMQVYHSDLITMLRRDPEQDFITLTWYSRNKKKKDGHKQRN